MRTRALKFYAFIEQRLTYLAMFSCFSRPTRESKCTAPQNVASTSSVSSSLLQRIHIAFIPLHVLKSHLAVLSSPHSLPHSQQAQEVESLFLNAQHGKPSDDRPLKLVDFINVSSRLDGSNRGTSRSASYVLPVIPEAAQYEDLEEEAPQVGGPQPDYSPKHTKPASSPLAAPSTSSPHVGSVSAAVAFESRLSRKSLNGLQAPIKVEATALGGGIPSPRNSASGSRRAFADDPVIGSLLQLAVEKDSDFKLRLAEYKFKGGSSQPKPKPRSE